MFNGGYTVELQKVAVFKNCFCDLDEIDLSSKPNERKDGICKSEDEPGY